MFSRAAQFENLLNEPVQVSKIVHKAFISVDEKGTEAGGATGKENFQHLFNFFEL